MFEHNVGRALRRSYRLLALQHLDSNLSRPFRYRGSRSHARVDFHIPRAYIRKDSKGVNRDRANLLQPYRLPDPARRSVPDASRLAHLFASRLRTGVCRIEHGHHDLLFFGRYERLGDVETELIVAAVMRACAQLFAV